MTKIKWLDLELFNKCLQDKEVMKAVAFAIKFKSIFTSSTMKDFSYRKIASELQCSVNTARKRIATLRQLKLAKISSKAGHQYLHLNKLRHPKLKTKNGKTIAPAHLDVDVAYILEYFTKEDIKQLKSNEITLGIRAKYIQRVSNSKESLRQLINIAQGNNHNPYEVKSSRKKLDQLGLDYRKGFKEYGLSQRTIHRNVGCGKNTVKKIVEYGTSKGLFCKTQNLTIPSHRYDVNVKIIEDYISETYTFSYRKKTFNRKCTIYFPIGSRFGSTQFNVYAIEQIQL